MDDLIQNVIVLPHNLSPVQSDHFLMNLISLCQYLKIHYQTWHHIMFMSIPLLFIITQQQPVIIEKEQHFSTIIFTLFLPELDSLIPHPNPISHT